MLDQVSALNLFKTILAERKSFPKDQPYKDLVALINYLLRQFFKAVEADPFVLVEVRAPIVIASLLSLKLGNKSDFMCAGTLSEEPKSMEEVFQLGARDEIEGQGSRLGIPPRCPGQERVHVERAARHLHGRPEGGWPKRTNRVGQRGPSALRGKTTLGSKP